MKKIKFIYNKIKFLLIKRKYKFLGFPVQIDRKSKILYPEHTTIGKGTTLKAGVILQSAYGISIGKHSTLSQYVVVYGKVDIGNHVIIGPHVSIMGGNHKYKDPNIPIRRQGSTKKGIIIEDDVWIGSNATILDGVRIGKGSVIGAGAVVTKNISQYTIAMGIPAKETGKRNG